MRRDREDLRRPIADSMHTEDYDSDGRSCCASAKTGFLCLLLALAVCAAAAFAVLWRVEATNAGACDFSGETALVRRALISLFFATNPVQQQTWTRCDSDGEDGAQWVSTEPYCNWKCVECDDVGAVTHLRLSNTGLVGVLPGFLANLTALQVLDVSGNPGLSGSVPGNLGRFMTNVSVLRFNETSLGSTLPATLASMRNLRELSAAGAEFEGFLPASLPPLRTLTLTHNKLSGTLAGWLASDELRLEGNSLSGTLPDGLAGVIVDLSGNKFSGTLPSVGAGGASLRAISLPGACTSRRRLAEVAAADEAELEPMTLASLAARDSSEWPPGPSPPGGACISGTIPNALGGLIGLVRLDIGDNQLSGTIPSELGALRNLSVFKLEGNSLSGAVPKEVDALGHNLVDIKKVKFGDCDLGDNCLNPVPDVCYTHDQRSQCGGPNATDEGWYDLQ